MKDEKWIEKPWLALLTLFMVILVSVQAVFIHGRNYEVIVVNESNHFEKLDEDSQKYVHNNIFSVIHVDVMTKSTAGGTCWSFCNNDKAWYVMTNYHVISKIVEEFNQAFSNTNLKFQRDRKKITKNNFWTSFYNMTLRSSEMGEGIKTFPPITIDIQSANIIYDRFCKEAGNPLKWQPDPNKKSIFAEFNSDETDIYRLTSKYQVDMALIELKYDEFTIKIGNNPPIDTSENVKKWIEENTYNWLKEKNDPPLELENDQKTFYYLGGYPRSGYSTVAFRDYIFGINKYYDNLKRADTLIYDNKNKCIRSSLANSWKSRSTFKNWMLIEGASGSPLLELIEIKNQKSSDKKTTERKFTINKKFPIAIYWGGVTSSVDASMKNSYFTPVFELFKSEMIVPVPTEDEMIIVNYNIFQNIGNLLSNEQNPENLHS